MKNMRARYFRFLAVVGLVAFLGACESGYQGTTSGTTQTSGGYALSAQDMCTRSCNNAHIRCMEVSSTRRTANESATSVYGAGTDCARDLRQCLPRCHGR